MMGFQLATMVQMVGAIVLGWDFWGVPSTPSTRATPSAAVAVGGVLGDAGGDNLLVAAWISRAGEDPHGLV
jgi:hypothetical protein